VYPVHHWVPPISFTPIERASASCKSSVQHGWKYAIQPSKAKKFRCSTVCCLEESAGYSTRAPRGFLDLGGWIKCTRKMTNGVGLFHKARVGEKKLLKRSERGSGVESLA
jgi:hypothetical protein